MSSRGIVLFAINNARIDYIQLARMSSAFIRHNMPGTDICLITDTVGAGAVKGECHFDIVVTVPETFEEQFSNTRQYRDTQYYGIPDRFRNESRSLVYELSPFDETLLLDTDYLICNNVLGHVWGNPEEIMINAGAMSLSQTPLAQTEQRLNPFGIRMYWATAIYFKKCERAKLLFNLVQHIRDNWTYYKMLYDIPGHLFRNDYAFSIAIHILNGFVESDEYVSPLPDASIFTALDIDQFYKINGPNDLSFFMCDPHEHWRFRIGRFSGLNIHCMNKLSLLNNMDSIMRTLQ